MISIQYGQSMDFASCRPFAATTFLLGVAAFFLRLWELDETQ